MRVHVSVCARAYSSYVVESVVFFYLSVIFFFFFFLMLQNLDHCRKFYFHSDVLSYVLREKGVFSFIFLSILHTVELSGRSYRPYYPSF